MTNYGVSKECNIILANTENVNTGILIKLYKNFVRSLLEHATVLNNPHNLIEIVQRHLQSVCLG